MAVPQGYVKKVKSPKVGGAAMGSKTGTGSAMKCIEVDESWVDMYVNTFFFSMIATFVRQLVQEYKRRHITVCFPINSFLMCTFYNFIEASKQRACIISGSVARFGK